MYYPLDLDTLHLRVYSDASFASNDDSTSQLGYIILLCDANDRCHVLSFSSKKSKRNVRSIMAGEIYALSAAFDHAITSHVQACCPLVAQGLCHSVQIASQPPKMIEPELVQEALHGNEGWKGQSTGQAHGRNEPPGGLGRHQSVPHCRPIRLHPTRA